MRIKLSIPRDPKIDLACMPAGVTSPVAILDQEVVRRSVDNESPIAELASIRYVGFLGDDILERRSVDQVSLRVEFKLELPAYFTKGVPRRLKTDCDFPIYSGREFDPAWYALDDLGSASYLSDSVVAA